MADQLQLRRGSTSSILGFTGAQGEIVVDTDRNTVVVQDGVTAGGFSLATDDDVSDGTFYYNEDVGSAADAYILVPKVNTNVPSSYLDGIQFGFVTTHPNTGPSTANFQGLGVKNLKYPGGVDPLAGEINGRVTLIYDAANGWLEIQRKDAGATPQIRTVGAFVGSGALTATLAPCTIDFRSPTLGSGVVNTRNVTSTLSIVVPSGATLGAVNAVASRIVLLAIYGPSNVELAVVNISGGVNLDETTVVNTTAISAGATAANVIYSAVARSGVPFRVVGSIDSTQATAGTWATIPSAVQGAGGQALAAMASLGYGQNYLSPARSLGTTYYNTTGKPIFLMVSISGGASNAALIYNIGGLGFTQLNINNTGSTATLPVIVPPGKSYSVTATGTLAGWLELS